MNKMLGITHLILGVVCMKMCITSKNCTTLENLIGSMGYHVLLVIRYLSYYWFLCNDEHHMFTFYVQNLKTLMNTYLLFTC